MKFQLVNGEMQKMIEHSSSLSVFKSVSIKLSTVLHSPVFIVDYQEIKNTLKEIKKDWFGEGALKVVVSSGIFWTVFMSYIFPIMLDIAKVFCAFKVAQAFYEERSGSSGKDGKSGFQSLVYWGKWYLAFWLLPWGVELIDQLGGKMYNDLLKQGITGAKPTIFQ